MHVKKVINTICAPRKYYPIHGIQQNAGAIVGPTTASSRLPGEDEIGLEALTSAAAAIYLPGQNNPSSAPQKKEDKHRRKIHDDVPDIEATGISSEEQPVEKGKIEDKGKSRTAHDQIICVYCSTIIMIKRVRGEDIICRC